MPDSAIGAGGAKCTDTEPPVEYGENPAHARLSLGATPFLSPERNGVEKKPFPQKLVQAVFYIR